MVLVGTLAGDAIDVSDRQPRPATVVVLVLAVLALTLFAVRIARAANPLVDARLFAVRAFSGASVVALAFSIAFGAMLLSIVLWCQDVWGWSALTTGLAVAPGPLMVPLFAFLVAGRLIARWEPGPVIGVGATVFAAGIIWWALAVGLTPDYAGEMLGGMLLTGPESGSRCRPLWPRVRPRCPLTRSLQAQR